MPLIECPECGREVSDSAAVCPACAYPIRASTPPVPVRTVGESATRPFWPTAEIIGRLAVGGLLLFLATVEHELGLGTGLVGLLVAGSAIPTWYRHRTERLRSGLVDPALADGLEDRMGELEHRHLDRIAELEERIDFAERLLTKQRDQIDAD